MSIENPFSKIRKAREQSDARKKEASRKPGVLNPRGLGGPVFDEMKHSLNTLGTRPEDNETAVQSIRELFEKKLHRRGLEIYNTYLQGEKGSPSHSTFEENVKDSFLHGFDLYLKVALRLYEKEAPDPHEPYRAYVQGKGPATIRDENDKNHYLKKFIEKGDGVTEDLNPHHAFTPSGEAEGYRDKYQATPDRTSEEAALDAYMFEKLRLFSTEFFDMFEESLKRGVRYENALELAEFVYGNDAKLYAEMEARGLEADVVAWQSKVNRARVRLPLETYLDKGPALEAKYPYTAGSGWVTSPKMIRNLTFKHPEAIEQGLDIVDRELLRLSAQFPFAPRRLIIEKCVASPETYEQEVSEMVAHATRMMQSHPMTDAYGKHTDSSVDVFTHYRVQGPLMLLIDRVSTKSCEREIKRALEAFAQIIEKTTKAGANVTYSARRRMLRGLLSYNAAPDKILRRETRISERHSESHRALLARAEETDPVWGEYFVELGYGSSDEDVLENGQTVVDLAREQYGDADGEEYLVEALETYRKYVDAGFSKNKEDLDALKDALVMAPYATKEFYENTLKQTWPKNVQEITSPDGDT